MDNAKDAWDEVGRNFEGLGLKLKMHFEQMTADTEADREEVQQAMRDLRHRLDEGFEALGKAMRDPAVRDDLTKVANSFGEALSRTFEEIGGQVRDALAARKRELGSDEKEPPPPGV